MTHPDVKENGRTSSRADVWLSGSVFALVLLSLFPLITGLIISGGYSFGATSAHQATEHLHNGGWRFFQSLHYWSTAELIFLSALVIVSFLCNGAVTGERRGQLFLAFSIFLVSLGLQITGNVMPMDRHGVQTASIEGAISSRAPLVGPAVKQIMLAGDGFSDATYQRWVILHVVLSLTSVAIFLGGMSIFSKRKIEREYALFLASLVAAVGIALVVPSPLGSAATAPDFNKFDALASWYTWPMHGALVLTDKLIPNGGWLGAMLMPGLFVGGLFGLILFGERVSKRFVQIFGAIFVIFFGVAAVGFGGQFASLVGTRDPLPLQTATQSAGTPEKQDKVMAALGRKLFGQTGCSDCHGQDGKKGKSGPTLTEFYKEQSDFQWYVKFIRDPSSVKPNSTMPSFKDLKPEELRALAEFLRFPQG